MTIEIDPIETIIVWLTDVLDSVSGQVASKHNYREGGWTFGTPGVSVHADGGPFDLDAHIFRQRLEIRIYADSTVAIGDVHRQLVGLSRENERFLVDTSHGNAFVYFLYPETGLSLLFDDVLNQDIGVVFFQTQISEEAVP